jgi:hypothetical protein
MGTTSIGPRAGWLREMREKNPHAPLKTLPCRLPGCEPHHSAADGGILTCEIDD